MLTLARTLVENLKSQTDLLYFSQSNTSLFDIVAIVMRGRWINVFIMIRRGRTGYCDMLFPDCYQCILKVPKHLRLVYSSDSPLMAIETRERVVQFAEPFVLDRYFREVEFKCRSLRCKTKMTMQLQETRLLKQN
jgi:hypothetical protein